MNRILKIKISSFWKEKIKNGLALAIGLFFAFLILEIFLRVYQLPTYSTANNELVLRSNITITYENPPNIGLDSIVRNHYNSAGFRGAETPEDLEDYLSIVFVGGSTTICRTLDEGKDWPHLLKQKLEATSKEKVWINNAGFNGNSTYGHLILLESKIATMKPVPNYIFYLIGINDIERKDLEIGDVIFQKNHSITLRNWLKKHSKVAFLLESVYRRNFGFTIDMNEEMNSILAPEYIDVSDQEIIQYLDNQQLYLKSYENRLKRLMKETQKIGSIPILLTQPFLFGELLDPKRGIDLGRIKTWRFENGKTYWQVLEAYNDITRKVAKELDIHCIDLAQKMPKSTEYFFDSMHFTNAGAEKVAEKVFNSFEP